VRERGSLTYFSLSPLKGNGRKLGMSVIARSASDEAISAENKDCFAPLAMTFRFNFATLPSKERGGKRRP
jgi:hypothetical protein